VRPRVSQFRGKKGHRKRTPSLEEGLPRRTWHNFRTKTGEAAKSRLPPVYFSNPQPAGDLHLSGAAEADVDLLALHHHRHPAVAVGEPQHLFQGLGILLHIPIHNCHPFPGLGLPGPQGKGSGLFAEDGDFLGHSRLLTVLPG
jgi:hypothetical protein